jgi:hypothetical protein
MSAQPHQVDALAKASRPHGIALEYGRDSVADCERTRELLTREDVTLFEATLRSGRRLAKADIIEKHGSVVHLIEVKSKGIDGAAHANSIQQYCELDTMSMVLIFEYWKRATAPACRSAVTDG